MNNKLFSEKNFIRLWTTTLIFIFVSLGIFSATTANEYREHSAMRRTARIDPKLIEPGMLPHETELPPDANPESTISLYIHESLGRVHLSRTLDYITFIIFAIGYTIINILIALLGITWFS